LDRNSLRFTIFIGILIVISACAKPMPNPESIDPIYVDLLKQSGSYTKAAEDETKKMTKGKAELAKLSPRDPLRGSFMHQIHQSEVNIVQLKQKALYYEIRAKQRMEFDSEDYLRAFNANKPWPNHEEFSSYTLRKKLVDAPRNWDARVPKLTRHNKGYVAPAEKSKGGENGGGGEHGKSEESGASEHH
jgi:hypothetical protein